VLNGRGSVALVIAKAPVPGRVKTRLCPPLSSVEAAAVAEAALADTLEAVSRCSADRLVLALEGPPGPWLPAGFDVVEQRGGGLDERLAAAWHDAGGPGVQVGMDTPQLQAADLDAALGLLEDHDAALGPADDGGWWAIALRRPDPACFLGIPMSTDGTGRSQHDRLVALGLSVATLRTLRDIDDVVDLAAVAAAHPDLRVSAAAGLVPGTVLTSLEQRGAYRSSRVGTEHAGDRETHLVARPEGLRQGGNEPHVPSP